MNYLLIAIFLLFFSGCRLYHEILYDSIKERGIQATKKGEIIVDNEVKAIIVATDLNMLENIKDAKKESFIVGIYLSLNKELSNHKEPLFFGNKKEAISIKKVSNNEDILKKIPTFSKWSSYYLVNFANDDNKSFVLDVMIKEIGNCSLNFDR